MEQRLEPRAPVSDLHGLGTAGGPELVGPGGSPERVGHHQGGSWTFCEAGRAASP